jgi:hypothetical protein
VLAELLELAHGIEESDPVDVAFAQEQLRLLGAAIDRIERSDAERGRVDATPSTQRLRSLVDRIRADVGGGHVRAIGGLERQVRCYVRWRSTNGAALER